MGRNYLKKGNIASKTATVKAKQIVARTARTMELEDQANKPAAIIRQKFNEKVFSWNGDRSIYLRSLRQADAGDISALVSFAR